MLLMMEDIVHKDLLLKKGLELLKEDKEKFEELVDKSLVSHYELIKEASR